MTALWTNVSCLLFCDTCGMMKQNYMIFLYSLLCKWSVCSPATWIVLEEMMIGLTGGQETRSRSRSRDRERSRERDRERQRDRDRSYRRGTRGDRSLYDPREHADRRRASDGEE